MKIKELRIKNGLSQAELANIANTSQRTISSYEKSNGTQNIAALIKIADYFHTTIDDIVGHEVPYLIDKSLLTNDQIAIIEEIKDLSPINCQLAYAYIQGLKRGEENTEYIKNKFKEE